MPAMFEHTMGEKMGQNAQRYHFIFDEATIQRLEIIRSYMKNNFGQDTDTAAVKAAIHRFAREIEEEQKA